jgi:hypothetical protein
MLTSLSIKNPSEKLNHLYSEYDIMYSSKTLVNSHPDIDKLNNIFNLYLCVEATMIQQVANKGDWYLSDDDAIDFRFIPSLSDGMKYFNKSLNSSGKFMPAAGFENDCCFSIITKQPNGARENYPKCSLLAFFIHYCVHQQFNQHIDGNESRPINGNENSTSLAKRLKFICELLNNVLVDFLNFVKLNIDIYAKEYNHNDFIMIERMIYIVGK